MTRLEFRNVTGRRLAALDLALDAEVSTILVGLDDGVPEILAFASGFSRPRTGAVRLDGRDPHREPGVRTRVALLLDVEAPFEEETVAGAILSALGARGSDLGVKDVLAPAGLEAWPSRRTATLSMDENRAVALAIALSVERPLLVALAEPFGTAVPRDVVLNAIRRFRDSGAVVLCTMASRSDAADLSGRVLAVQRRRRRSEIAEQIPNPEADHSPELVVRADDAAKLAAILAADPDVSVALHDAARAPRVVLVRGPDLEQVSLAVLRVASLNGIVIAAIEQRAPASRAASIAQTEARP